MCSISNNVPRQGVIGELAYFLIGECGLVQEVEDYSDLECHFIDVMDSNDICTPTSKEDPSYYTLLEFLRQFLPKGRHQIDRSYRTVVKFQRQVFGFLLKGLHQTIDDKKVMIFPHQTLNL